MTISSQPHGPAVTIRIQPKHLQNGAGSPLKHDIYVDFSAIIDVPPSMIPVTSFGWPREKTFKVMTQQKIEQVKAAGLLLVPKNNDFWFISFSKPGKLLLRCIDSWNECRRRCHKILKRDYMSWNSEEAFPGVSTYMFKVNIKKLFCKENELSGDFPLK